MNSARRIPMIAISNFQITPEQKEILPMDDSLFPYICNYTELNNCINRNLAWHWHHLLEFDYIEEGEVELSTADNTYILHKGDVVFINSGILHTIGAHNRMPGCSTYAHLFDMHFLSGMYNSLFEQKYMLPIIQNKAFQIHVIHPDSYRRICMIEKFLKIVELNRTEPSGYEFEIRTELGRLWCMLLEETEQLRSRTTERNTVDAERLKLMMEYIHSHYTEKVTLEDIAFSASISTRECSRCFQRCIKIPPVNYLSEYRIRMAAQMLLSTNESILTISENCGFSSGSYFSKVFQEYMGCTPKEYRKKNIV